MEEAQAREEAYQQEVERAEPHYGHDVRGVGQERVPGDGEHGRDGVQREDDVGELDGDEREEEDGGHAPLSSLTGGALADKEGVLAGADGVHALEPGDPARLVRRTRELRLSWHEKADGGDEEDGAEDIGDRMKAGEEGEAARDEDSAHDVGAGDAPEEHLRLADAVDRKEAKEQEKDEEVIDGEGFFDCVAGEVLNGGGSAEAVTDVDAEGEGSTDPEGGGSGGRAALRAAEAALPTRVEELRREQEDEDEVEAYPLREGRGGLDWWRREHIPMLPRSGGRGADARQKCGSQEGCDPHG